MNNELLIEWGIPALIIFLLLIVAVYFFITQNSQYTKQVSHIIEIEKKVMSKEKRGDHSFLPESLIEQHINIALLDYAQSRRLFYGLVITIIVVGVSMVVALLILFVFNTNIFLNEDGQIAPLALWNICALIIELTLSSILILLNKNKNKHNERAEKKQDLMELYILLEKPNITEKQKNEIFNTINEHLKK